MRKQIITSLLSIAVISTLTIGCGGSSSPTTQVAASTAQTQTTTQNITVPADGIVPSTTTITASSEDNQSTSTVTIVAGTKFTDTTGTVVTTPQLAVIQNQESTVSGTNTNNTVQTEIKLTDGAGNNIIPSEPIDVKVKAPVGAKPGDEVSVDIPEAAGKATDQQKLVVFVVEADGTINVRLFPDVFRSTTVILIIIEKIVATSTLSGGTGGN